MVRYTRALSGGLQTCEIVMERNVSRDVQITDDTRLRERKLGAFEGRPIADCRQMMKSKSKQSTYGMETKQQVREHAVSFFSSVCDMILAAATSAPSDLDSRSSRDLDSRSGSLKRKHVGSTPSLSELDHAAVGESTNGSRPTPTGAVSEEDSSSSSLSASSGDLAACDDFLPEETGFRDMRSERSADSFGTSHSQCNHKASSHEMVLSQEYLTMSESAYNRNMLPGFGGWMVCPNVSLEVEDAVRSLERESSTGSGCHVDFGDSDDPPAQSPGLCANVLVVSHGGFISQLLGHFADDFNCCLPGGEKITSTVTPNAALSRFLVTVSQNDDDNKNDPECVRNFVWIRCVALHDKDHLANDVDVEPLPLSEPL